MQPIKDTVKNIPKDPGVYFFKNNKNDIIYIGKAKNIRNRVRTYFQKNKYQSPKNISMIKRIVDVEWIVVTKDNVDEVMEKVKAEGGDYALFAVTDEGYKKLSLNFADIRNKLYEQQQIILSYKEYYEDGEREQPEGTD